MKKYTKDDVLKIGKRQGNKKRKYLLINPLQGKHIPTSAVDSFEMMDSFFNEIEKKIEGRVLLISFAETATGIGSRINMHLKDDCYYLQTTRESFVNEDGFELFLEEHSHAVEQKVNIDFIKKIIDQVDTILFLDDEISTGKTLINIYDILKKRVEEIQSKKIVVASILNRLSDENANRFTQLGIEVAYLIHLPVDTYEDLMNIYDTKEAKELVSTNNYDYKQVFSKDVVVNPRLGSSSKIYEESVQKVVLDVFDQLDLSTCNKVLVLGTEECMYPSLLLSKMIEEKYGIEVKNHSTTRSPIGIFESYDYPIKNGYKLKSFYDANRPTYIYNLDRYDRVLVVTDAYDGEEGMNSLITALKEYDNDDFTLIKIGKAFGSFKPSDVTLLLKDITGLVEPLGTKEREIRIQSGTHYSEMLPKEYVPTPSYFALYKQALHLYSHITSDATAILAEKIIKAKGNGVVLVSLARAGTPVGILLKRYIKHKYGIDVPHYTISIIRGKGIDKNAMDYILSRHPRESIQFIDGWTGKGAIRNQLREAIKDYPLVDDGLAVLSDPAYVSSMCGTHQDFLIASSCLNSTVSGLLSRTFYRTDIIKENDFHGSAFARDMSKEDVTYEFIHETEKYFDDVRSFETEKVHQEYAGLEEVKKIAKEFDIKDINLVKPGIGEATRVLLRRVPWKLLVWSLDDEECLGHLYQLAKEKGVPLEVYPLENYKACGIIKALADN